MQVQVCIEQRPSAKGGLCCIMKARQVCQAVEGGGQDYRDGSTLVTIAALFPPKDYKGDGKADKSDVWDESIEDV